MKNLSHFPRGKLCESRKVPFFINFNHKHDFHNNNYMKAPKSFHLLSVDKEAPMDIWIRGYTKKEAKPQQPLFKIHSGAYDLCKGV